MLAKLTPTERVNPNTDTDARTLEFITPNALRCHCQEYRTQHFCLHLVFYTAAKIQAHRDAKQAEHNLTYHKVARLGYCGECGKRTNQMAITRDNTYPYTHKHYKCAKCPRAQGTKGQGK